MERSNQISWAQVRAGIFILAALVVLAGAILLMGQKTKLFTPTSALNITMDNVAGLKVGARSGWPGWMWGWWNRSALRTPARAMRSISP